MKGKTLRLIIDTNLWISFLITKNYKKLDAVLISKKATLLFSEELLLEFIAVTKHTKFKKYFSKNDVSDLIEIIEEHSEFIQIKSMIDICRDPKDNFLLALSLDGKADYLKTGDKDLLDLKKTGHTTILNMTDFLLKF